MKCQNCDNKETKVIDTRVRKNGSRIRLRKCHHCQTSFKTTEILGEPTTLLPLLVFKVRKRDGTIVEFDEIKITNSISISIRKPDRASVPLSDIVMAVKEDCQASIDGHIIDSTKIGERILVELKKYNVMAYIRYASIYMDLKTVDDFTALLHNLTNVKPK